MVRMILFWVVSVLFIAACDDFELPKMGGLGEPCFQNGLCEGGLVCVDGTCVAPTGDGDVLPEGEQSLFDEDALIGDGEEEEAEDASVSDVEEPEGDVGGDDGDILPPDTDILDEDSVDTDIFDNDIPDTDVVNPVCGNGTVEGNEACDDGNKVSGDGCSADCLIDETQCLQINPSTPPQTQESDDPPNVPNVYYASYFPPTGELMIDDFFVFYFLGQPTKGTTYYYDDGGSPGGGIQVSEDLASGNNVPARVYVAYSGFFVLEDYLLKDGLVSTVSKGHMNDVFLAEVNLENGKIVPGGLCLKVPGYSWDTMAIGTVGDLTAQRAVNTPTPENIIAFSWTCLGSGVTNYLFKRSRAPITSTAEFDAAVMLYDDATSCSLGEVRTINVPMNWYDGVWHVAMRPYRQDGTAGPISNDVAVNTGAAVAIQPNDKIEFGLVGYNSTKDITVTVTNTSPLVDLEINQIYLPMDCGGKVSIVSGGATPGDYVKLVPGETREVVLRYAPTETSSCGAGDRLLIQWITHGNPYYASSEIPISGNSANTPPAVIVEFTKNPVKASAGTTRIFVYVIDENSIYCGDLDQEEAVWNKTDLGGAPRENLPNLSCSPSDKKSWYWTDISVASLPNGIYALPITITDKGGNIVTTNATFAVYSGNILEVGDGKTYADIKSAVDAAANGDVVVVHPGTYTASHNTGISPGSKNIMIYGIGGPQKTVLDGSGSGVRTFVIDSANTGFVVGGLEIYNNPSGAVWSGETSPTNRTVIFTDCRFTDNAHFMLGGAILASGSINLTVAHSRFFGNSTGSSGMGGAVYLSNGAIATFVDVLFEQNSAETGGAVTSDNGGTLTFDRSVFTGNTSTISGGALELLTTSAVTEIRKSVFFGNRTDGSGGAIIVHTTNSSLQPVLKIYNSTIADNSAANSTGGIHFQNGTLEMKDTILFFNTAAPGNTTQLYMADDGAGNPETTATISYCDIGGGPTPIFDPAKRINNPTGFLVGTNGNLSSDPLFLAGDGGSTLNYRLMTGSPCINAGSASATVPTHDFLGYPRFGNNEIGAFEYPYP